MEITNMETRTYEAMMASFESFAGKIEVLCLNCGDKGLQKWLDNQEVCRLLSISKRTLQTYRDTGILPFSQIGHKMFYRSEDVKQLFEKTAQINNRQTTKFNK